MPKKPYCEQCKYLRKISGPPYFHSSLGSGIRYQCIHPEFTSKTIVRDAWELMGDKTRKLPPKWCPLEENEEWENPEKPNSIISAIFQDKTFTEGDPDTVEYQTNSERRKPMIAEKQPEALFFTKEEYKEGDVIQYIANINPKLVNFTITRCEPLTDEEKAKAAPGAKFKIYGTLELVHKNPNTS